MYQSGKDKVTRMEEECIRPKLMIGWDVENYHDDRNNTFDLFYTDLEGKSPLKRLRFPHAVPSLFQLNQLKSVHGLIWTGNCIWNPTNNQTIRLPEHNVTLTLKAGERKKTLFRTEYYLGFDSSKNSYKVLCIIALSHLEHRYSGEEEKFLSSDIQFKILELGSSSWRDMEFDPSQLELELSDGRHSCSIDNFIFILCKNCVLAFDVRSEKFEVIPIPDGPPYMSYIIPFGEYISIIETSFISYGCPDFGDIKDHKAIYILEDINKHKWRSETIAIDSLLKPLLKNRSIRETCTSMTPFCAINTGEILIQISVDGEEYYYYYHVYSKIGRNVPELRRITKEMRNRGRYIYGVFITKHIESIKEQILIVSGFSK